MIITICADASYDQDIKRASYGYTLYKDGRLEKGRGLFRGSVTDNNEAEVKALQKAIAMAIEMYDLDSRDSILAFSDSTHAIGVLTGSNQILPHRCADAVAKRRLDAAIRRSGVTINIGHVKAHQTKCTDDLAYFNTLCDYAARTVLLDYRQAMRDRAEKAAASAA